MELSNRPVKPIFANESIVTQVDGFGEKLEGFIKLIVDEVRDSNKTLHISDTHPVIKEIEKAVQDRFGLKISVVTDEHLAAILPFYSNRNHIFIEDFFRGYLNIRDQTKLLKTFDEKKGTVNLQKATVSGIFSEYDHPFYVNFNSLIRDYNLNATEITGVVLHELGHAFYACYYADRSDRTNQVLASVARHLISNENGDIEYVYKELSSVSPSVSKDAVDKMLNGPRVVAGATWFKTVIGIVRSQTLNDKYNDSSFEERADNFASRFGYGKSLVLGLDKLSAYSPEKSGSVLILAQLIATTMTVILAVMVFSLLAANAGGLALVAIFYNFIFYSANREDAQDYTYDKLKQRYLRVRMDAVDQLKNTKLHKDKVKGIIDSIYIIDDIIKSTKDVKTLPNYIANFIFSGARKTETSISDQQLMEALASNDIFLKSAELRIQA